MHECACARACPCPQLTPRPRALVVQYPENDYGPLVEPLYPACSHPAHGGRPNEWDQRRDPFHARGASGAELPVELDVGDRFEPAEDVDERAAQSQRHGVEGSWGDRRSFMRAHGLIPDVYRQDVADARRRLKREIARVTNGVI